jgi:hypothetical protein
LPQRASLLTSEQSSTARATREKYRIHAGLRDDGGLEHVFVVAHTSCADRKRKFRAVRCPRRRNGVSRDIAHERIPPMHR